VVAALLLQGCGSAPGVVEPPRLKIAHEAESAGAKNYRRGDYGLAARQFEAAVRAYAGIDDTEDAARNRLHLARAELALGHAEAALQVLPTSGGKLALETLLIKAQAQLALARRDEAQQNLGAATGLCAGGCPQFASLNLLQARAALADGRAPEALQRSEVALNFLQGKDEANETANAWRLIAAARLAAGDATGALPAAHTALEMDRQLALPEKIARDWLLIGDIERSKGGGGAAEAYRRALEVADAAGLVDVGGHAARALAEAEDANIPRR
jgi:tetratricopeptide (TPR) repeat protein